MPAWLILTLVPIACVCVGFILGMGYAEERAKMGKSRIVV